MSTHSADLYLGFAFSLMPDGSPGAYNDALATYLNQALSPHLVAGTQLPMTAVQWEIADALKENYPELFDVLESTQRLIVASPSEFIASEIDAERILNRLGSGTNEHTRRLLSLLDIGLKKPLSEVDCFNALLNDSQLFKQFDELELVDLVRPELGELFTEYRKLPDAQKYPEGLRQFQTIRLNRLILEAIIEDESVLPRTKYLSTPGVIESILTHKELANEPLRRIHVVAHPLHTQRCLVQLQIYLNGIQKNVTLEGVYSDDALQNSRLKQVFAWQSSSAQVWCRSLANWQRYETKVRQWLAQPSREH